MGFFSGNKNKDKLALVFYIGSSSVGGALFVMQTSGIPKLLISLREKLPLQKTLDIDNFESSTLQALGLVADKIYTAGLGKPEEIFCVLSSPWHVSQTRAIRLQKNAPFVFSSKLAFELIEKEISFFEEEYIEKYKQEASAVRSIEFKNIKTMLNGYESISPINQKTKELEMTIYISISSDKFLKKIEEAVRTRFHFKKIRFSSFTLSSFAVVRDIYAHKEDFILIDIDGEMTDITMVKKNILRESISFPLGTNSFARGIALSSGSSIAEAESLVSLLKDAHAEESVERKNGPVLNKLKQDWLHKFQESLSNLSNDISVPSTIYLCVDKGMANLFSEIIKNEQFNQYTLTESKFEVIFLEAEVFHGMVLFEGGVERDPFLISSSIYINRFLISASPLEQ